MKSQLCAGNSGQTTKSIADTCIDGGRVCEAGTNRNNGEFGKCGRLNTLFRLLVSKSVQLLTPQLRSTRNASVSSRVMTPAFFPAPSRIWKPPGLAAATGRNHSKQPHITFGAP